MPIFTGAASRRGTAKKLRESSAATSGGIRGYSRSAAGARRGMAGRPGAGTAVYPPREDTELLRPFARASRGTRLLEIGCGRGVAALDAARAGAWTVATDRNPAALAAVRDAAARAGLVVRLVRTDLARGLGRFDRILANPPYLPTPRGAEDPDPWTDLALNGGPDGLAVTARLFRSLPAHLGPGGRAYVVTSSLQEPRRLARLADAWTRSVGPVREVASRALEGERLAVLELARGPTRGARRGGGPRRRTGGRRRTPAGPRAGSSPAPASGRTPARGAASGRRRSRPGS